MGKFRIEITKAAEIDIQKHYKSGNNANINKISKILSQLAETPYTGIGNPEKLKYDYSNFWSRRINKKDRIIYTVDEVAGTVYIASAIGHYLDK